MVRVVGNIEARNLLVLAFLKLLIGQFKALVFLAVVGLDGGTAAESYHCGGAAVAIYHRELHGVAFLPVRGVEGTCAEKDVQHIENAVVIGMLGP